VFSEPARTQQREANPASKLPNLSGHLTVSPGVKGIQESHCKDFSRTFDKIDSLEPMAQSRQGVESEVGVVTMRKAVASWSCANQKLPKLSRTSTFVVRTLIHL
jgi:hypothetical protein